ncbi:autophagy protein 13 [Malassezia vespertilionis]|nr:autophagy protein 13 [Malassezia vespertilionis]WFD07325.1 autophagy protein 13 [Malassezia vespertilionis]
MVSKLDSMIYHFFSKTVAVAAESRLTDAAYIALPSSGRSNKWFSLEIDELDRFRDVLQPWRTLGASVMAKKRAAPLYIDVYLRTSKLDAAHVVAECQSDAAYDAEAVTLGNAFSSPILLERWRIDIVPDEAGEVRLPAVYKRAIVHFRTLYALSHALPTYNLCRRIREAKRAPKGSLDAQLELEMHIRTDTTPGTEIQDAKCWSTAPVQMPGGAFQCFVEYRALSHIRVERNNATQSPVAYAMHERVPKNAVRAMPASSNAPSSFAAGTSPFAVGTSPLAHRMSSRFHAAPSNAPLIPAAASPSPGMLSVGQPRKRRSLNVDKPLNVQSSYDSPLLRAMRIDATPEKAGGLPVASRSRHMYSSSSQGHWSASQVCVRTLLQNYGTPSTRPTSGISPSSFGSLRTPPQGGFDAYMRRANGVAASPSNPSFGARENPQSPERARPQRIQRYSHQPSYRQRDAPRSAPKEFGDGFGASSGRSWSQRIMDRNAIRDSPDTLARSHAEKSPSTSRLFVNTAPSHAPAFALTKQVPSRLHIPNDDLAELVSMLDTPPALHDAHTDSASSHGNTPRSISFSRPSLLYARGPSARTYFDDALARLADSTKLPSLGAFGIEPRNDEIPHYSQEDEAVCAMELLTH